MAEIEYRGQNEEQNRIAAGAMRNCTFPMSVLDIATIPIEWADLSRYTQELSEKQEAGAHLHFHEGEDTGHPIEVRSRVLGLAWYSGRVTLDASLQGDIALAGEVLLSEFAHMVDFFWMTDRHRMLIWNALHPDEEDLPLDTNVEDGVPIGGDEGWFDVGDYRAWVGEAWMGLFVRAYSDYAVTIPFNRAPTDDAVAQVRAAFTPYASMGGSEVYHDTHKTVRRDFLYVEPPTELRPCKTCRPENLERVL